MKKLKEDSRLLEIYDYYDVQEKQDLGDETFINIDPHQANEIFINAFQRCLVNMRDDYELDYYYSRIFKVLYNPYEREHVILLPESQIKVMIFLQRFYYFPSLLNSRKLY